MNDTVVPSQNKTVLMLLAVIVALLLVIIVVLMVVGGSGDVPAPTVTAADTQSAADAAPSDMPPATVPADFDPATATRVPEGVDPADFAAQYYEAVLAGDWDTAFAMQPTHKQTTSVEDFSEQLLGYGIVGYTVTGAQDMGEQYVVMVDQETGQFGIFENQWVFVLDEGAWLLQDKAVTGMK